jgi:predicted transcriptional regulator
MARKSRNHQFDLPPLELQCMKILWALEKGTVREIRARLQTERPLAYTTVMTVMDRLSRKGVVEREKRGRAHLYRPAVSAEAVREHALNRLIENFFQGSRDSLRQHLEHSGAGSKRPAATEPTEAAMGAGVNADIDPTLP